MVENVHPIIIKSAQKCYRLLNIAFERDQSIYIQFPRKRGYIIHSAGTYNYSHHHEDRIDIDDLPNVYSIPKISFHPKDCTAHVKSGNGNYILGDYKLHNFLSEDDGFACPFAHIVFPPNYKYFDEYTKTKYKYPLYLNGDLIKTNLNLFLFIHSYNTTINQNALNVLLPFSNLPKRVVQSIRLVSNALFTCTVFLIDGNNISNDDVTPCVILLLNTEDKKNIYKLEFAEMYEAPKINDFIKRPLIY